MLKCEGFHFDEAGALTKWQGVGRYNTTRLDEGAFGPAAFRGLFQFTKSDGTSQVIGATAHGLYRFDNGRWLALQLPPGFGEWAMFEGENADFAVLQDQLYICNGFNRNLRYDGAAVHFMGIAAPDSSPTLEAVGIGPLTGTYSYRVTFVNIQTGHESNPSPLAGGIPTANQRIRLSNIPVSPDPQVTARRLYRTTANGGIHLFLAQIDDNLTTEFTDDNDDSQLDVALELLANGVPPVASMFLLHRGMLLMVPRKSSRVWFSKPGFPNAVHPNDFRDLDPNDGSVITALGRLYDTPIAFKGTSIWNGSGEDRNTLGFVRQVDDIGAVNHDCVVSVPGQSRLFFLAHNGFYSYDGVAETYESVEIEPLVEELNQTRLWTTQAAVYQARNMLLWAAPTSTNRLLKTLFVYDYAQRQWTTRSVGATAPHSMATVLDDAGQEAVLLGGNFGFTWRLDVGLSDDGQPIIADVIDRAHPKAPDARDDAMTKAFYELTVFFEPTPGSFLAVSAAVDDWRGAYLPLGTVDLGAASGQATLRFRLFGRRLYPRFVSTTTNQPVRLREWLVTYKVLGRVKR